ncbi:DEAD/DEAH box helicase [Vreelandella neptunia]|uniref:AAA domain-containing protein n=1 Tax=Vreelandella neptunia TaxID=115551 RepID=A0ABZ0YI36_9GAMM|nr:AAA domain-containing protein [Halomonas neptunia]MDN3562396.1 AAA domain-containing protein [Halomonas neptunia]WQH11774.1 AAA domain-containing protein [Halomonas neptunia]
MPHLRQIREAISVEELAQRNASIFHVASERRLSHRIGVLRLNTKKHRGQSDVLSEALEGANAWWPLPEQQHGTAIVLSVFPEDNEIQLTNVKGALPSADTQLRIYPPNFIEPLRKLYHHEKYATAGLKIFRAFSRKAPVDDRALPVPGVMTLRKQQEKALTLPYQSHALLFGPPGTGKTYTLSALIAQFLLHEPDQRVLLLSHTNAAVDDALVKVDKALERLEDYDRSKRSVRIGKNFSMQAYKEREHLLPSNEALTSQLAKLEKEKPEQKDAIKYDAWLTKRDNLRKEIDEHTQKLLHKRPLVATTAASAGWRFEQLMGGNFDWVVFDEASQVSLYQVIALLPLGKRYLFCGDDRQLPPVYVAHTNTQAQRWMGKSIFSKADQFPETSKIFLDEQDRMLPEICELVSHQFYEDRLKTAVPHQDQARTQWQKSRQRLHKDYQKAIDIVFVEDHARWRQRFMGEVRHGSAEKVVEIYQSLADERDTLDAETVILAPLHSQLRLIREMARKQGISTIPCSTIHKAQGREYHTVILDVINLSGNNRFLSEVLSKELINVAFSRAKARLIVLANEKDLNSKYIKALQPTFVLSAPLLKAEPNASLPYLADYAPIGEHNVEAIRNQLFNLLLPSGDYIQVKPLAIQDQYLRVEKHSDGQLASYRLTMING